MKILVPVKRVIDYNVKPRVKADGTGVDPQRGCGPRGRSGHNGQFAKVDVTDEQSVLDGIAIGEGKFGPARILVNCAGIAPSIKTVGRDGDGAIRMAPR